MMNEYTVEYAGVCLDLNVSARGVDITDVGKSLLSAMQLYLQDIEENTGTVVSPIPTGEFIEFLQDTVQRRDIRAEKQNTAFYADQSNYC